MVSGPSMVMFRDSMMMRYKGTGKINLGKAYLDCLASYENIACSVDQT